MAPPGAVHSFEITVSDVDRGFYDTLSAQVARHPSESPEYFVTRVLAWALEHQEGITFSHGLHAADEPALWVHDLTGQLRVVIEVGAPDVARLHKATKAADQVIVWCHKDAPNWRASLVGQKVYAPEKVTIVDVPRALVAWLGERLDRRNVWELSVTEGELFAQVGGETTTAFLVRSPWPSA